MRARLAMSNRLFSHLTLIQQAALQAVDPAAAVRRALSPPPRGEGPGVREPLPPTPTLPASGEGAVVILAIGKAAPAMARAAIELVGKRLRGGLVVTRYGHAAGWQLDPLRVIEAGHPVPDRAGLQAAEAVLDLLGHGPNPPLLQPGDQLLALISGGASALLPLPAARVTLGELQTLTGLLLYSGASIDEINTVRKHLERLKGGELARAAVPTRMLALVLSDVVGDRLEVIASGPTVPDPTTWQAAWQVLERYDLVERLPDGVRQRFQAGLAGQIPDTPKPDDPLFERVTTRVIGSNRLAAQAAVAQAEALGYRGLLLTTFVEGEARQAGLLAAALAKGVIYQGDPFPAPACIVFGGETTVTVRGPGKGGRNQELALAAALAMEGLPGAAVMALATDGSDGPTDAAGALVDGSTAARIRQSGSDPDAALAANDSYPALHSAGALLHTGPTGTNVNDLTVILVEATGVHTVGHANLPQR